MTFGTGSPDTERLLDDWIDSLVEGSGATDEPGDLADMALLVRAYGAASIGDGGISVDGETASLAPVARLHRRPSTLLRVAAVVVLAVALAVGLLVGLGRSPSGAPVPVGRDRMPAALLAKVEAQLNSWADPYPKLPVLWVRTTLGRLEHLGLAPADSGPASQSAYMVEARGRFWPVPSNIGLSYPQAWLVIQHSGLEGMTTRPPGHPGLRPVHLSQLGTVESTYLRPPSPTLSLPTAVLAVLQQTAHNYRYWNPALAAQWVTTTLGHLEQLTGKSPAYFTIPGVTPRWATVWVVRAPLPNPPHVSGPVQDFWLVSDVSGDFWDGSGLPSDLAGLRSLFSSVRVSRLWLPGGVPTTLGAPALAQAESVILGQFGGSSVPAVRADWVGTTVGAVRQLVPRQTFASGYQPSTSVRFLVLQVTPQADRQWHTIWLATLPDGQSIAGYPSDGGSDLFGIRSASQLGRAHQVVLVQHGGTAVISTNP